MHKFLFLAFLLVFACNKPKVASIEKPADLISEEKMVQVLVDVHLLEAALNLRNPTVPRPHRPVSMEQFKDTLLPPFSADPNSKDPLPLYDIFKKHDITKKQYEASMKWYCSQPEKLSVLYEEVITELTKLQLKQKAGQ